MFEWPRKSRSTSGFKRFSKVLMILSYGFSQFLQYLCFRGQGMHCSFLLSCHVWVTSKILVNFRYRRYLKVLMIVSYKFLKFLHYLCFRGQGIYFWHSYWATMFGWPRKSRSTSGSRGSQRYWWFFLLDFHNFFSIYVFEVKESIADIPVKLPCLCDLENLGQLPVQKVLKGTDVFVL